MEREPNTQYILSLSYGKDSLACLEAIKQLGWPLDRIVHAEVGATDTIHADLPPMVEFKKKADKIIKERYGIEVEHVCAIEKDGSKQTYEKVFYQIPVRGTGRFKQGTFRGFPYTKGAWCNDRLKLKALNKIRSGHSFDDVVQYLGIAFDEPVRIARHSHPGVKLPLVEIGGDEAYCRQWCEDNDLLSPIYSSSARGGCWFCHAQGIEQLRLLRKNYPDLGSLLLKWDNDSPVTFKPDGHTVHDYDKRFELEELDKVPMDRRFRGKMIG